MKIGVLKFGGTSVKDASAMEQVGGIISHYNGKAIIVLSACSGITDRLINLANKSVFIDNEKRVEELKLIENYHLDIIDSLIKNDILKDNAKESVKKIIGNLERLTKGISLIGDCSEAILKEVEAQGEYFSSAIFYNYLTSIGIESEILDSFNYVNLSYKENYYFDESKKSDILQLIKSNKFVVMQGFACDNGKGRLSNLGRGGSDYSAAIIAGGIDADELLIYTDVDGVYSADPRIVKTAKLLDVVSYRTLRSLAFFGAKVVHPGTLIPAFRKNIPIRVLNTFNQNSMGTLISKEVAYNISTKSLVLKKQCRMIKVEYEFGSVSKFKHFIEECEKIDEGIITITMSDNQLRICIDEKIYEKIINMALKNNLKIKTDLLSDFIMLSSLDFQNESEKIGKVIALSLMLGLKPVAEDYTEGTIIFRSDSENSSELCAKIHDFANGD